MEVQDIAEMIKIMDHDIDALALAARVAANLRQHALTGPAAFPAFAIESVVASEKHGPDTPLTFDLSHAVDAYADVWVSVDAPTGGRMSLVARFKHTVRTMVVYYVNRLAERQTRFNAASLRVMTHLVNGRESSELADLRREVARLQQRIDHLERLQKKV